MILTPQTTPVAQPTNSGDLDASPLGISRFALTCRKGEIAERQLLPASTRFATSWEGIASDLILPGSELPVMDETWAPLPDIVCAGDDPFDDFEEDDFDDDFDDDFEEDWEDDLTQDDEFPDTFGGQEEEEDDEEEEDSPFKEDPDFDE